MKLRVYAKWKWTVNIYEVRCSYGRILERWVGAITAKKLAALSWELWESVAQGSAGRASDLYECDKCTICTAQHSSFFFNLVPLCSLRKKIKNKRKRKHTLRLFNVLAISSCLYLASLFIRGTSIFANAARLCLFFLWQEFELHSITAVDINTWNKYVLCFLYFHPILGFINIATEFWSSTLQLVFKF